MRLKDFVQKYDVGLKEVLQINPITFRYKKDNGLKLQGAEKEVGISAQELQKIIPASIKVGSKNYLQFQMDYVNWALVNSVKELKAENDQLLHRLDRMESALATLERQSTDKMARK